MRGGIVQTAANWNIIPQVRTFFNELLLSILRCREASGSEASTYPESPVCRIQLSKFQCKKAAPFFRTILILQRIPQPIAHYRLKTSSQAPEIAETCNE